MKVWIALALVLVGGWNWWQDRPLEQAPGVLAPEAPLQEAIAEPRPELAKPGYRVEPLARFELTARVLRRERYRFDRGAELAPVDLALGWGRMSDSAVLGNVKITQGARFYYWSVREFPIPRGEIETSSANMHLVPANTGVANRLKALRAGEIVHLSGYLVEARGTDGFVWRSSLTRGDTGAGSCELVWVEQVAVRRR